MASQHVKTRLLIISDTHGAPLYTDEDMEEHQDEEEDSDVDSDNVSVPRLRGFRRPLPSADVAIHCGDLTEGSAPGEYETTLALLREIDAPLKLVIVGNHDRCLDPAAWDRWLAWMGDGESESEPESEGQRQRRRLEAFPATVAAAFERARDRDGILLLDEGTYHFVLRNGARLSVFASQFTPAFGGWAFQYRGPHAFAIPPGVDVAMTHGPPRGILDRSLFGAQAGCRHLRQGVAAARPRVHCFGHIHEAWGAKLVTWHDGGPLSGTSSVSTSTSSGGATALDVPGRTPSTDEDKAIVLEELANIEGGRNDDPETRSAKTERHNRLARKRCCHVSLCAGDEHELQYGKQTLFVNASIMDLDHRPAHLPWLVDLELPEATEEDRQKATDPSTIRFPRSAEA